jgi:hypothetical protein
VACCCEFGMVLACRAPRRGRRRTVYISRCITVYNIVSIYVCNIEGACMSACECNCVIVTFIFNVNL